MKQIKFRYRVMDLNDNRIITYFKTLDEIETGLTVLNNRTYQTISKDLFTGLKDKNGREIYEKDILKMKDGTRNPYTVVWSENLMGWGIDGTPGGLLSWLSEYIQDLEIIGNVHENPELLTNESK